MKLLVADKPCCEVLGHDIIQVAKINIAELCDEDLDLLILGHLNQYRYDTTYTQCTTSHTKAKERKRAEVRDICSVFCAVYP